MSFFDKIRNVFNCSLDSDSIVTPRDKIEVEPEPLFVIKAHKSYDFCWLWHSKSIDLNFEFSDEITLSEQIEIRDSFLKIIEDMSLRSQEKLQQRALQTVLARLNLL